MAIAEKPKTEVRAIAKFVHTAPRKAMLVADQIRGRSVPEARTILAFLTRDAARDVARVLDSAVANAEANHGLSGDDLYVASATVGAGPTLKRFRPRARGRVGRIKKRTCHIEVTLGLPGGQAIPAPLPPAPPPAAAEEKPKRAPRKKAEAVETSAAEAAVVEAPAAADEPPADVKPKRAPRKRAEPAPETEVGEEKPKRARRKPEPAPEPAGEGEKPVRKKKSEES